MDLKCDGRCIGSPVCYHYKLFPLLQNLTITSRHRSSLIIDLFMNNVLIYVVQTKDKFHV